MSSYDRYLERQQQDYCDPRCPECNKKITPKEEHKNMCFSCGAKLENE